ncbi:MAG: hypothetical protein ATN32_05920 [Candidatus Epulonipiscium fishelsonii]|nr:MAG: hypothetical protein ATN32_05920 [Epulopiscium sp. AS2M-Bin002]
MKKKVFNYKVFEEYIINFKYILIDLNDYNEEDLIELKNVVSTIFLLDKANSAEELLIRAETAFTKIIDPQSHHAILIKNWLKAILKDDVAEEILKIFNAKKEGLNMTFAIEKVLDRERQQVIEEGIKQGIEKGKLDITKKLLDILDNDTIALKTELPIEVIIKLREENM